MDMSQLALMDSVLLLVAALAGGLLNAIAGGGSFLTFPALVYVGVPPVAANATGTLALLPGYLSATYAFRNHMAPPPGMSWLGVLGISALGGGLGAALLVITPDAGFQRIVPWLLLVATVAFAASDWLLGHIYRAGRAVPAVVARAVLFGVTLYGGYFNGGVGILLLAALGLVGMRDMGMANGAKNLVSFVLTLIAVILYARADVLVWPLALPMMLAGIVGGLLGGILGRRLPRRLVRAVVILTGASMTGVFFLKV